MTALLLLAAVLWLIVPQLLQGKAPLPWLMPVQAIVLLFALIALSLSQPPGTSNHMTSGDALLLVCVFAAFYFTISQDYQG